MVSSEVTCYAHVHKHAHTGRVRQAGKGCKCSELDPRQFRQNLKKKSEFKVRDRLRSGELQTASRDIIQNKRTEK